MYLELMDIHGNKTIVPVFRTLTPSVWNATLSSKTINGVTIYYGSFTPSYSSNTHILEPYVSTWTRDDQDRTSYFFPPDNPQAYVPTKEFHLANEPNTGFTLICNNGSVIQNIKYQGVSVTNSLSTSGGSGDLLAFFEVTVNGIEGIALECYRSYSDGAATKGKIYTIGFISKNFFAGGTFIPYSDGDKAGDPDETGGTGGGVKPANDIVTPDSYSSTIPSGHGLNIYALTPQQFAEFGDYLWGRNASVFSAQGLWARWQNYKFNPVAAVISCHYVPSNFMLGVSATNSIAIAGTDLPITCSVVTEQFVKMTFNWLDTTEEFKSFADYIEGIILHIPFCGAVEIDPSCCRDSAQGRLGVEMCCDVVTGNVMASIIAEQYSRTGAYVHRVVATATGNCAYNVPVSGSDSGLGAILGVIQNTRFALDASNPDTGIGATLDTNLGSLLQRRHTAIAGNHAGSVGYCGTLECWAEVTVDIPYYTPQFNHIIGRPSHASGIVSDFAGYAEFDIDDVEVAGATDSERSEIRDALRGGVYV